jgi:hypothetical protein
LKKIIDTTFSVGEPLEKNIYFAFIFTRLENYINKHSQRECLMKYIAMVFVVIAPE